MLTENGVRKKLGNKTKLLNKYFLYSSYDKVQAQEHCLAGLSRGGCCGRLK